MKVKIARDQLAKIPLPKTAEEYTEASKRADELRTWVDRGTNSPEEKECFDDEVSKKQEEMETSWRSHEAMRKAAR